MDQTTTTGISSESKPIDVSIVIPTRNRAGDLRRCLESLAGQSYPLSRVEILICDDGSTEPLAETIKAAERAWSSAVPPPPGAGGTGRRTEPWNTGRTWRDHRHDRQ
jgi:cellulose synthase/poly-beta-1,6-N-acetylglucosamine synthase-like glycosyltransferase